MDTFPPVIDVDEQRRLIVNYPKDVILQLMSFGTLMINEVEQRTQHIDSKLGSYLGYGAALVALLGISELPHGDRGAPLLLRLAVLCSVGFASGAIWVVVSAMRAASFPIPGEADWFRAEHIHDGDGLQMFHVIAMLKSHKKQHEMNEKKGEAMMVAEPLLAISATIAALSIAARVIFFES